MQQGGVMGLSWAHVLIIVLAFVMLFGRGKISELMGDVARGIKSFRKRLADSDDESRPKC
jgi:sec-independent protein translocase protein TatA